MPIGTSQTVTIEVTTWPLPCDIQGMAIEGPSDTWSPPTEGLPRKEASTFLRGMRRYGRIDKVHEFCDGGGAVLADAPPTARYALWHAIESACNTALAAVEAQGLDPKDALVRGVLVVCGVRWSCRSS